MSGGGLRRIAGAVRRNGAWNRVQQKLDHVVAVRTEPSIDEVRERLDRTGDDLRAELRGAVDDLRRHVDERADHLAGEIRRVEEDLRRLSDAVRGLRDDCGEVRFDLDRIGPHVAALEVRIADAARTDAPLEADAAATAESRRLLDEVTREHERIRVRFSGLALYEERLRKLEEARWPGASGHPTAP